MARLRFIAPRLGSVAPRVARVQRNYDAERSHRYEWRRWYGTARWQRLRWQCLVRDLFTCVRCGQNWGHETKQLHADHIKRHQGNEAMFFDPANVQTLCAHCHNADKQREEAEDAKAARF
jgi:5-methylcytosine-specific restriction endonuclease McrA